MHELSIAQSMLDTIEGALGRKTELVVVNVTVGALSGVSADALEFCFTDVARTSGFGTPHLDIHNAPAKMHCRGCGADYETRDVMGGCPTCDSLDRRVLGGMECTITSVEIKETADVGD